MKPQGDDLHRMELQVSKFLRYGVVVAGVTMLVGWSLSLFKPHVAWNENPFINLETFHAVSMSEQISQAVTRHDYSILISYLGLAALVGLPVIRVFLTAVLFFKQKEKVLAYIALFVLSALLISMGLGFEL